ncbi:MAG: type II 3-dehydroquinate dehydratase [Paramuribaculum sp.]|nr:type II 3-dehydroquinate dehydratase [Paramuribaculum sp.]
MKQILIINGPNLNLLGTREPGIYGSQTMDSVITGLRQRYPDIELLYYQSNHEGDLIDRIHAADKEGISGIVLNAGAYTHTSLAIADAIAAVSVPVVEVHISNISSREPIRHNSLITPVCRGIIAGFGTDSYRLAIESLL